MRHRSVGPLGAALITASYVEALVEAVKSFIACSQKASDSPPILMAKATASKDKKKPAEKKAGEKGKGKAEETADKGGKVRTY